MPTHDEKTYEGPFGLSRSNSLIFYITFGILTVLAAAFLIITGVFYSQSNERDFLSCFWHFLRFKTILIRPQLLA